MPSKYTAADDYLACSLATQCYQGVSAEQHRCGHCCIRPSTSTRVYCRPNPPEHQPQAKSPRPSLQGCELWQMRWRPRRSCSRWQRSRWLRTSWTLALRRSMTRSAARLAHRPCQDPGNGLLAWFRALHQLSWLLFTALDENSTILRTPGTWQNASRNPSDPGYDGAQTCQFPQQP